MCLAYENTAAVCVGLDKIQMIQVKDKKLTLGRVVTVGKYLLGITSSSNYLVVSYSQRPWIEKVSMDGQSLEKFDNGRNPKHFKHPEFMCTVSDGSVFISDRDTKMITKLDANLKILQKFKSRLLKDPHGIISVTEDQILVCSQQNHSIVMLQPSTNTMSTLLGVEDQISCPYSLTYCPDQKKLFVALHQHCPDTIDTIREIKVYQIA